VKSAGIGELARRLADERSRRVVVLSHCLLNQNVRYLGGAWSPGVVPDAVEPFIREGIGISQMPCPEQVVWGGVLKRLVVRFYGSRRTWAYRLRGVLFPLFLFYTRWRYRQLARRVAREIEDYVRSGFEVVEIVGVGDSPSCGVRHTLDLARSLPIVAEFDVASIERRAFNDQAVRACIVDGQGLYMRALRARLERRGLSIAARDHDPGLVEQPRG
jgi:predicted secreted protein